MLDSLFTKLDSKISKRERLEILESIITRYRYKPDTILKYENYFIALSEDDEKSAASVYFYLGQALKEKGKYEQSVTYLYKSMELKSELGINTNSVESLLASVYGRIGDIEKSSYFFHRVLNKLSNTHSTNIVVYYNNFGEAFYQNGFYDSAYFYFKKGLVLAYEIDYKVGVDFMTGNLGMVNLRLGNLDSAEIQLSEVIINIESNTDAKLTFQTLLAEVYQRKGRLNAAIELVNNVIYTAEKGDYKEQIRDGYRLLSQLYEAKQDYKASLDAYRSFVAIDDSIKDVETVRRIGDMRTEFEVGQKQAEVDVLTAERKTDRVVMIAVTALAVVLLILGLIVFKYYRQKAKTNEELERLNQTKDKFFSIISHDLRGPVSSFMGISRMIKYLVQTKETDQLLEVADDIDESVDRLSALLDNLLSWAMQQQGHFPNVPEKVSMNEIATDLTQTLATMAKGKQIELTAAIDQPIDLWVDKNTTKTILRNLVNNALKFTPEGGHVTISAEKHKGLAQIKIVDTGVGIAADKLKTLFKLQDKKSTYGTAGEKGLGLGLQLVYEFVEMNGGDIKVESAEGSGTTFTVSLPLYDMESNPVLA